MKRGLLKAVTAGLAAATMLAVAPSAQAATLAIGDAYYLGYINDGIPSSPSDEVNYINSLLGMGAGTGPVACSLDTSEQCDRSGSSLNAAGLPTAVITNGVKNETGTNTGINVTGWSYLLAKYDGPNYGSVVWYVGGLNELVDIPQAAGSNPKGGGYGLSHYSLYNFSNGPGPDPDPVPEPAALALLGLGLLGAGIARRRRS